MFVSYQNLPTGYLLRVSGNSANVLTMETWAVLVTGTTANSVGPKWSQGKSAGHPLLQVK